MKPSEKLLNFNNTTVARVTFSTKWKYAFTPYSKGSVYPVAKFGYSKRTFTKYVCPDNYPLDNELINPLDWTYPLFK